ncbi:MAG: hypothetical protein KGY76_03930 [Candidatus Thermoplasmatota archaeon]|nr:hypothetical protein [Candidatus Thermoplasmatota archaeon]
MKAKKITAHLLGSILVLSTIYHSETLYSLLVVIPFLLVSYCVHREKNRFVFPSLLFVTLFTPFFISAGSLNELFSLFIFLISFAVPLLIYWLVVLLDEPKIRLRPLGIALSYVFMTGLLFYLLPALLGISDFIISAENRGPQTLLFLGTGMLIAVPYHMILEMKD